MASLAREAASGRHVERLANRLRYGIMSRLAGVVINGDEERRYPGNMNMSFAYVEGESLIMGLKVRRQMHAPRSIVFSVQSIPCSTTLECRLYLPASDQPQISVSGLRCCPL